MNSLYYTLARKLQPAAYGSLVLTGVVSSAKA
jgi:hypothetical protein